MGAPCKRLYKRRGFYEFRVWLLAQAKDVFYSVLKDPINAHYEQTGKEWLGFSYFMPKLPEGIPCSENVIAQKFPKLALN